MNVKKGETETQFEDLKALEQDHYRVEEEEVADYTSTFTQDEETLAYTFTNTVKRDAPKPEKLNNANTGDNGIKIFFIAGGAMAGLIVAAGITIRRTMKKA